MFSIQDLIYNPTIIQLCLSLIILLITLMVKRFLSNWIINGLSHLQFHKVRLETSAFDKLKKPIHYVIISTGIFLALVVSPFGYYTNSETLLPILGKLNIMAFSTKFYCVFVVIMITWIIYDLERLYEQFFTELNEKFSLIDNTIIIRYLARIINCVTLAIGIASALTILIPNLSSLMTGVGIGGAVIALVAKDSLTGIIAGMFLLLDKPFVIGDWVDIGGVEGKVEDISFRSTRIRTASQALVIIPNNTISNANITNCSRMEKRRVAFELGVSYATTPQQIDDCTQAIKEMLLNLNEIEKETIAVHFMSFGDFSLNIQIIYYTYLTQLSDYLAIQDKVNLQLLQLCEQNHIDIAFPTQTILLPSMSEPKK